MACCQEKMYRRDECEHMGDGVWPGDTKTACLTFMRTETPFTAMVAIGEVMTTLAAGYNPMMYTCQ